MLSKSLLPHLFEEEPIEKFFQILTLHAPSAALVGGAIRDAVLNPGVLPNDLDIVVSDQEYLPTVDYLIKIDAYIYYENRHGNARFLLDEWGEELHIDLWSPGRFYSGYASVEDMLKHFDMSVNALGVHLLTGHTYDPTGALEDLYQQQVRLLETQWTDQDEDYAYHLVKRLNKLLDRYPDLTVVNPELAMAQIERLEKLKDTKKNTEFELLSFAPDSKSWHYPTPQTAKPLPPLPPLPEVPPPEMPPPPLPIVNPTEAGDLLLTWSPETGLQGHVVTSEDDEEDVCETWKAGDRCPGCMGCPFEGPNGMYADD